MFFRILSFFAPKSLLSKFMWAKTIGIHAKVHALPLAIGAVFGLISFLAQSQEIVTINLSFLQNQTILDSLCAAYSICGLEASMPSFSSILLGCFVSVVSDKLYMAESPKYPSLIAANDTALKGIVIIESLTGNDIPTAEDANE